MAADGTHLADWKDANTKNATIHRVFRVLVGEAIGPTEHEEHTLYGAFFMFSGWGKGCAGKNISYMEKKRNK